MLFVDLLERSWKGICAALLVMALAIMAACAPNAPPNQAAESTVLDEKAAIAVETIYATSTRAGALAYRIGIVEPSDDPLVQRDDFCAAIAAIEGGYDPPDRGAQLAQLECRLRQARDTARAAYDAGNAETYDEAFAQAMALATSINTIIGGGE
jgi:hypothetical protein